MKLVLADNKYSILTLAKPIYNTTSSFSLIPLLGDCKILIDKFNSKYDKLNERQKSLLRKFINNVSDTSSLKEHIISEVPYIKRTLNRKIKSVNDPVLKIKLAEVMKQANRLGKSRTIKDKEIVSLLKLYELITELKNVK